MEAETGGMHLQAKKYKGVQQPPEATEGRKDPDSSLEPLEGAGPC